MNKICPKCNTTHNKTGTFCSRKCSNSRTWSEDDKRKKSETVKKHWKNHDHPCKGKPGWKHTEEQKKYKRKKALEQWDIIGRKSEEHFKKMNRYHVAKYNMRKKDATPDDANFELIKLIYENCPEGYEVDHIIAIAAGGLHHQNNLQYLPSLENKKKGMSQNYDKSLAISWQDVVQLTETHKGVRPDC
jgi:hypothetical protein